MASEHESAVLNRPQTAQSPPAAERSTGPPVTTISVGAAVAAAAHEPTAAEEAPSASFALRRPPRIAAAAQAEPIADDGEPPTNGMAQSQSAPLPVLRIVCWQFALVVGLLAIGRPWQEAVVFVGAAVILLATTAVRVRGNWLSTLFVRRLTFALRGRSHDLTAEVNPSIALLRLLAPGSAVLPHDIGEQHAGIITRREETLAVLRPVDTGVRQFVHMALAGTLLPVPDPEMPDLRMQLILHRGPRATGHPVPQPRVWLAVRALREVDLLDDEDLWVAVNNTVRRAQRRLSKAGLDIEALGEREIHATLTALTHTGSGRGSIQERWRFWCSGSVFQAGLRVRGLGPLGDERRDPVLERMFAAVPNIALTAAVASGSEEPLTVLRACSPAQAAVDGAADQLIQLGTRLGVHLERLDGLHARAVAATLPIGGKPL